MWLDYLRPPAFFLFSIRSLRTASLSWSLFFSYPPAHGAVADGSRSMQASSTLRVSLSQYGRDIAADCVRMRTLLTFLPTTTWFEYGLYRWLLLPLSCSCSCFCITDSFLVSIATPMKRTSSWETTEEGGGAGQHDVSAQLAALPWWRAMIGQLGLHHALPFPPMVPRWTPNVTARQPLSRRTCS